MAATEATLGWGLLPVLLRAKIMLTGLDPAGPHVSLDCSRPCAPGKEGLKGRF